jgi:hypothetical protein
MMMLSLCLVITQPVIWAYMRAAALHFAKNAFLDWDALQKRQ